MEEIFRSDAAVVTREPGFIRLRRSSLALVEAGPNVAVEFAERFRLLVPLRERRNLGFLLDSRDAPMIGDDAVFVAMRPVMINLVMGFSRVAFLMRTAVGILQASRRARGPEFFGPQQVTVFADEAQAIAYVTARGK